MFNINFPHHISNPKSHNILYNLGEKADAYISWSGRKFTWINEKKNWEELQSPQKVSLKVFIAIATLGIFPLIALIAKMIYRAAVLNYCEISYYGSKTVLKKVKNFDLEATLKFVDQFASIEDYNFYQAAITAHLTPLIIHQSKYESDAMKKAQVLRKRGNLYLAISRIPGNEHFSKWAEQDLNVAKEIEG